MTDHINSNGSDNKDQPANKVGHSSETALHSIKNKFHLFLSKQEALALVLLAQSVAFDIIDYSTLLSCLPTCFGLSSTVLRCFRSYLIDRFQVYQDLFNPFRSRETFTQCPSMFSLGFILFSRNMYYTSVRSLRHPAIKFHFYQTALKGCRGIVFTHGVRMGGRREKVCPGCISETVRFRKLILGRNID